MLITCNYGFQVKHIFQVTYQLTPDHLSVWDVMTTEEELNIMIKTWFFSFWFNQLIISLITPLMIGNIVKKNKCHDRQSKPQHHTNNTCLSVNKIFRSVDCFFQLNYTMFIIFKRIFLLIYRCLQHFTAIYYVLIVTSLSLALLVLHKKIPLYSNCLCMHTWQSWTDLNFPPHHLVDCGCNDNAKWSPHTWCWIWTYTHLSEEFSSWQNFIKRYIKVWRPPIYCKCSFTPVQLVEEQRKHKTILKKSIKFLIVKITD